MSMNGKEKENWYAPMEQEESGPEIPPEPESAPRPERKRRRSGLRSWKGLVLLGVLAVLLIGSSLLFSGKAAPPAENGSAPAEPSQMPKSFEDFFDEFYEDVDTDSADTQLPRTTLSTSFSLSLQSPGEGEGLSLQELYERCQPSIVAVSGTSSKSLGGIWGTGIILSPDGLILTNCHMIEGCDAMEITLWDNRSFMAELVGADAVSDLAVLRIPAKDLPAASFGDSSALRVGDRVAAIGNPLGATFRSTLTDGIISAIERGVSYHGHSLTLLQTNTAINEGNSGGALFNMYGQVVGVTNMKMRSSYANIEGIGFAIPSTTVRAVVNDLTAFGKVQGRVAVGITVGEIPLAAKKQYGLPDGLYVSSVSKGSDAEAQGIRRGDVVTAVDGTPVTGTTQVNKLKEGKKVGDVMTFTIWRRGETLEITVRLMDQEVIYPD